MAIDYIITSALNLSQDQVQSLSTSRNQDTLNIYLLLINKHPICPYCGADTSSKGLLTYTFKTQDIAGLKTIVNWKRRRYKCRDCHRTFSEDNIFTPDGMHSTFSMVDQIMKDLGDISINLKTIALRAHVSIPTVELYADSYLRIPRQFLPEYLGIDELYSDMALKNSSYLCVMVDNKARILNEVIQSRSKRELSTYFENIPLSERQRVKIVTMDMWQPYKDVVKKYLPNAIVAVDPFHVIEHLTSGFSRLRIDIMNRYEKGSRAYYLLKTWHKLLGTDYDLDNEPKYNSFFRQKLNYRNLYDQLLEIDPVLTLAYHLKEVFRNFNRTAIYPSCINEITSILDAFISADIPAYKDFLTSITNWKEEYLNSFRRPYDDRKQSNALSEYMNSRLRVLINVSNGLSNFPRFRARALYALNRKLYYTITDHLQSNKRIGKKRGSYKK